MSRIAVIGGTGFAGQHIVTEAVDRGHTVISVARHAPADRVVGANYVEGTLLDVPSLVIELAGVDVSSWWPYRRGGTWREWFARTCRCLTSFSPKGRDWASLEERAEASWPPAVRA